MTSLAVAVIAASVVMADPQFDAARKQIKVLEPLIGEWFWDEWTAPKDYSDIAVKMGDKFKRIRSYEWDLVNSIVVGEVRLENAAGKRLVVAKSLTGWDATSGKMVGTEFWAGPFGEWYAGTHEWSVKGNILTVKATGSLNMDKSVIERDFIPDGKDALVVTTKLNTVNGTAAEEDEEQLRLTRLK